MIRLALLLFCKRVILVNQSKLQQRGPLLLVANHPNSFFDAVIIAAFCRRPIHFLARGDIFKKKYYRFFLGLLNMIPIYRLSEGKEHLWLNEYAFKRSQDILQDGGIILIFIEGICVNSHFLQPFKKGASRIAEAYTGAQPLKIVPVGLAYNSFKAYGKAIEVHIGTAIDKSLLFPYEEASRNRIYFNEQLKARMEMLVRVTASEKLPRNTGLKWLAAFGGLLHRPLYSVIRGMVAKKTAGTVFYDSVLFGVLLVAYPLYLIMLLGIVYAVTRLWWLLIIILFLHIFTARCVILTRPLQR